jgi:stage III sporulation protein AF
MALMDALAGWLRQIIAVVLLASLVDLLLPNRTMQRYVRLVAGLFILLTVAGPILQWVKGDFSSQLTAGMQAVEQVPEGAAGQLAIIEKEGDRLRNRQDIQAADLVSARLAAAIQNEVELSENRKVRKVDVETTRTAGGAWTVDKVTVLLEAEQQNSQPAGDSSAIDEVHPIEEVNIDVTVETWPGDTPGQVDGVTQDPAETSADRPIQLRVSALIASRFGIAADHVEVQQALAP